MIDVMTEVAIFPKKKNEYVLFDSQSEFPLMWITTREFLIFLIHTTCIFKNHAFPSNFSFPVSNMKIPFFFLIIRSSVTKCVIVSEMEKKINAKSIEFRHKNPKKKKKKCDSRYNIGGKVRKSVQFF